MPGIFGILDLGHNLSPKDDRESAFRKMAKALQHHQEDRFEQAYLMDSRLMIGRIGLPGQTASPWPGQPDESESGIHLFVSGPILDRDSDESLRQLPDSTTLRAWRGFFSALLIDPVERTTILLVDRTASNPIYFVQTRDYLLFAPEVKALTVSSLVDKAIDMEAFATFMAQGYLLSDQTLFRSVRRLRGGELLKVKNGTVARETYWRYSPGSISDGASETELERELGHLLNASAQKHLGEPGKTVIFLSGGVDSRGILGAALAQVHGDGRRLNTVSWGASQGTQDSDVSVAASIARHLNTNHRFLQRKVSDYHEYFKRVNYLIDGISDVPAFHPYEHQLMVELRSAGYQRVLRGDEVFGLRSFSASSIEGASVIAYMQRLRGVHGLETAIRPTQYKALCEASDSAIEKALAEARDLTPNQAKDFFYFAHRLQSYLQSGSYFRQVELDQRNVLLDDSILDFMAKVPDSLRIDKMLFREVVKHQYPDLARFPYAKRYNFEDWWKLLVTESPVREFALEELNDRSSGIWEFLDPEALMKILEGLGKGFGVRSLLAQWVDPKALARRTLTFFAPGLVSYVRSTRRARPVVHLESEKIIMRALVLKNWHDTFV